MDFFVDNCGEVRNPEAAVLLHFWTFPNRTLPGCYLSSCLHGCWFIDLKWFKAVLIFGTKSFADLRSDSKMNSCHCQVSFEASSCLVSSVLFWKARVPVLYKFLQIEMRRVAVPEALASQVIAMKMIGVNLFALQPSFLEYATKQTKRCLDLPRANQSIWQLVCILPFLYQFADNPRAVASSTLEMRYEYIWTPKDYVVFASRFPNCFSNSAKDEAPVLRRLKKSKTTSHTHTQILQRC